MNHQVVESPNLTSSHVAARQSWMRTLASCPARQIKEIWNTLPELDAVPCEPIRQPERGLVMVRARAGSAGQKFNLGEMTVTRCAVRLDGETVGVSYISGRDPEHALIAAKADAMLQTERFQQTVRTALIEPLERSMNEEAETRAKKIAATRVNFFTMVRTREDKK